MYCMMCEVRTSFVPVPRGNRFHAGSKQKSGLPGNIQGLNQTNQTPRKVLELELRNDVGLGLDVVRECQHTMVVGLFPPTRSIFYVGNSSDRVGS